jgi:hypothetical protein
VTIRRRFALRRQPTPIELASSVVILACAVVLVVFAAWESILAVSWYVGRLMGWWRP